jgi:fucose permease
LPLDRLGVLLFFGTLGYLTSSFVGGPVTRRFGVGGVLVGSSALVVASALGFAGSTRWPPLLGAALLAGAGAGAIDASINAFAATHFPAGRIAWLHASYGVGASAGPLLMTGVLAAGWSWRWGYGLVAILLALLGAGFVRTRRLWESARSDPDAPPHAALRSSLTRPVVHASGLLFLVYTGVESTPGAWVYSLLTEARGVAPSLAGTAVALYWGSLTLGRVASGALAHRWPTRSLLRSSLFLAPAWGGLLWAGLHPLADLFALAALGFTVGPVFPLLIAGTPTRVGEAHSANAVGIQISLASIGWAALPAMAGVLARHYGLEVIPPLLVAGALFAALMHEAIARAPSEPRFV